jgi:exo-1,4-beta-D-glucosaminidase
VKSLSYLTLFQTLLISSCASFHSADSTRSIASTSAADFQSGWFLQTSDRVGHNGVALTSDSFKATEWMSIHRPTTVLAGLLENKVYPDPDFGSNLQSLPGSQYTRDSKRGDNFSLYDTPADSPFSKSWWYFKSFLTPTQNSAHTLLRFEGINYSASVYLNGIKIADPTQVVGSLRSYELDVSPYLKTKGENQLAVEVTGGITPRVLSLTWVDWAPNPPDKNMGIFRDVELVQTGDLKISHSQVRSEVPALNKALLTVDTDLENLSDRAVSGTLAAVLDDSKIQKQITLTAHEKKTISFLPSEFKSLVIHNPKLWWPKFMGAHPLHHAEISFTADQESIVSDREVFDYGIREVTSVLDANGFRLYKINGHPVMIRGGGWSNDLFLRQDSALEDKEMSLVENLNLNTLRFEGQIPSKHVLELTDHKGILVMAGLSCCSFWENWGKWDESEIKIALASLRDELNYLKNHASVFTYLYASDESPPPSIEARYLKLFKEIHWPNPTLASAASHETLAGPTGVKMSGPYDYVPPRFWSTDTKGGGAFGFNTETSPGAAVPPIETLKSFLPADHLWPIDEVWLEHTGGDTFHTLDRFNHGLNTRYGESKNLEEYARKAQIFAYDNHRGMFEAYSRKKYVATTGIVQWMLNNPWNSMIWHLFDHELRSGGSYFGAKKANEPLHIQYAYSEDSVVVVNQYTKAFQNLHAEIHVYDFDLKEKFHFESDVNVDEDSVKTITALPALNGISKTYFLKLDLKNEDGDFVSRNFYWLSTQKEVFDFTPTSMTWVFVPTKVEADLTELNQLALARVSLTTKKTTNKKGEPMLKVNVKNTSTRLAFGVHLKVNDLSGNEVLPTLWEDNYISLLPGESRTVNAVIPTTKNDVELSVTADGWNLR